jgi:hypothetical protein
MNAEAKTLVRGLAAILFIAAVAMVGMAFMIIALR